MTARATHCTLLIRKTSWSPHIQYVCNNKNAAIYDMDCTESKRYSDSDDQCTCLECGMTDPRRWTGICACLVAAHDTVYGRFFLLVVLLHKTLPTVDMQGYGKMESARPGCTALVPGWTVCFVLYSIDGLDDFFVVSLRLAAEGRHGG